MHFWAERVEQATLINPGFNLVWPFRRDLHYKGSLGISVYGRCRFSIGLSVLHKICDFSVFMSNTTFRFPVFSIRFSAKFKAIIRICVQSRKFRKNILFGMHFQPIFFLGGGGGTSFFYERMII